MPPAQTHDRTTSYRRSAARAAFAVGTLSLLAFHAQAQQTPGAPQPASADSGYCAAATSYVAAHPAEVQRTKEAGAKLMMELMESPEMQEAIQTLLAQAMADSQGVAADDQGRTRMTVSAEPETGESWPDSIRIPFADAIDRGQFDSAGVIARHAMKERPEAAAMLPFMLGSLKILPDTLRSLYAASLRQGSLEWMNRCEGIQTSFNSP